MSAPEWKKISEWRMFGGRQLVIEHQSPALGGATTRTSIFLPPGVERPPVVYYLSGLTCTWENVTSKAGMQRVAAELGLAIVCPDTSPRGEGVADAADRWDLGCGAGFYVDATAEPWSAHYHMYSYITRELPALVGEAFGLDTTRQSVMGHSMGGHGALVLGLREPALYRAISAFSPIVAPSQVQWGRDAFGAYLASEQEWAAYDATELVADHARPALTILIDQGQADSFLDAQLRPELFVAACEAAGQPVQLRRQEGYDHSYYFIASFVEDHLRHHAAALNG
jgi:S-formylglutathione hydrolase